METHVNLQEAIGVTMQIEARVGGTLDDDVAALDRSLICEVGEHTPLQSVAATVCIELHT